MKVVVISDLHIDTSQYNEAVVWAIVESLEARPVDIICLLGDVSSSDASLNEVLKAFDSLKAKKFFVPGNHDVWLNPRAFRSCKDYGSSKDSFFKLFRIFDTCRERGWHSLMSEPCIIDDIGFVGTMGWYDYSFRDVELDTPIEAYEAKHTLYERWVDGDLVYWKSDNGRMHDRDVTKIFNLDLEDHLKQIEGCSKKVCCSHFIPFKELQDGMHRGGSFFNAFGGNRRFGQILVNNKVDVSFSGHLHRNLRRFIQGIDCYQTSIGYLGQDYLFMSSGAGINFKTILEERVLTLDL